MAKAKISRFYVGNAAVFVAAFAAAYLVPVADWLRGFLAVPVVVSLVGISIQLWRDQRAHERSLELQQRDQDFTIATATHMANIAYDKHVAFCEAYMERVNVGVQDLFQKGPHSEVMKFAYDLSNIRLANSVWLTEAIESQLTPFEKTLREIAASEMLLEHLEAGEERKQVVEKMYRAFGIALEFYDPANDEEAVQTRSQILNALRRILGTEELTELRVRAAESAAARVQVG